MKETSEITYEYDPVQQRLFIYENGKHVGGFHQQNAEKQFTRLLESGAKISIVTMSSEIKRKQLVRRLRASWIKQGIDKHREHILSGYGVESTADLTVPQLEELITIYNPKQPPPEAIRKLRSIVLKILTSMGIYIDGNWDEVNRYMLDPRICGKVLYQLNENELQVLIRKLNSIADKKEEKDAYMKRISKLN